MFGFKRNKNETEMFDTSAPDWFYEEGYTGNGESGKHINSAQNIGNGGYTAAPETQADTSRNIYTYKGKNFSPQAYNNTYQRIENTGGTYQSKVMGAVSLWLGILSIIMVANALVTFAFSLPAVIIGTKALKADKSNSSAKAGKIIGTIMLVISSVTVIFFIVLGIVL